MRLNHLKLVNFRNYDNLDIGTKKRVIILVGDNAQGKTNFLEAVYLLAITKSFRLRSDADLVGEKDDFVRIEAEVVSQNRDSKIEVVLKKQENRGNIQKIIKLNGQMAPVRAILGAFSAVLFCPEDINLIKAVPGARRRFLDIVACKVNSTYCETLMGYNKILKNRNQVLVRINRGIGNHEELIFWNNELTQKGSFIIKFRQNMAQRLASLTKVYYNKIAKGAGTAPLPELNLHYLPSFHVSSKLDEEAISLRFRGELLKREEVEIARQQTLSGPHRDDFTFILGRKNIVFEGSRGEFRSAILSLKLSELDFLKENLGERPVLLLDDVFSELDRERKRRIAALVKNQQVFIATTDLKEIPSDLRRDALILEVEAGKIEKIKTQSVK